MSTCRSCGADVIWGRTPIGNLMPLNAEPNPDGNVEAHEPPRSASYSNNAPMVIVAVHPGPPLFTEHSIYMPHHATCPDADTWRKQAS